MQKSRSPRACSRAVFLIVGALTVLEFLFVRGMFTWMIAVAATVCAGLWNIVLALMDRRYMDAALFLLCSVALCMGYFVIGG